MKYTVSSTRFSLRARDCLLSLTLLCLTLSGTSRAAAPPGGSALTLLVQPILSEEQTKKTYQPLADYLSQVTGQPVEIHTSPNFMAYWDAIRRNQGDFILDAAHFTDYRVQKFSYKVLAKIPGTVSYSLVVPDTKLIFDSSELTGKAVASLGPPSIGAVRLNALFPNPVRQPTIVEVASAEKGMELVAAGKVDGAILPTPMVGQYMARNQGITVVTTTEPLPHIAISAAPRIDATVRGKIRTALVNATQTPEGRKMLNGIGFERFDPATDEMYTSHSRVLKEYWGY
jgi:ABC-type phosphate/phosphonate transport system substrate-binding protein